MNGTKGSTPRRLPFYLGYLTDEIKAQAEKELGETDEVKRRSLLELRKLMTEEKTLLCSQDETFLLSFLRTRKFNVDRTWKSLRTFFILKGQYSHIYVPNFEGIIKSFREQLISILSYRDQDACPIVVFQLDKWNLEEKTFASFYHDGAMALLHCAEDTATQVTGIKLIFDCRCLGLRHVSHVHPKYLYYMAKVFKECLPLRLKEIHFIYERTVFYYFWNIIKFALSAKIRNRVHIHSSESINLTKHLPTYLVPIEYGGTHHIDNEKILERLMTLEQDYHEKIVYGYYENVNSVASIMS